MAEVRPRMFRGDDKALIDFETRNPDGQVFVFFPDTGWEVVDLSSYPVECLLSFPILAWIPAPYMPATRVH